MIAEGEYGYRSVNVRDQQRDPGSLLSWFETVLPALRETPEFGVGTCTVLDTKSDEVLALRYECPTGSVLAVLNLGTERSSVDLSTQVDTGGPATFDVLSDRDYAGTPDDLSAVEVDGSGYRWIRLARVPSILT